MPHQDQNEAHWWLGEGNSGFGAAQGLPTEPLEKPWYPKNWDDKMEKKFQELVQIFEKLAAGKDETEGRHDTFHDPDAALHQPVGGEGN